MLMKDLEGTKIKIRSMLYRHLLFAFYNKKKTEIMSTNQQAAESEPKSMMHGVIALNESTTTLLSNNFWTS